MQLDVLATCWATILLPTTAVRNVWVYGILPRRNWWAASSYVSKYSTHLMMRSVIQSHHRNQQQRWWAGRRGASRCRPLRNRGEETTDALQPNSWQSYRRRTCYRWNPKIWTSIWTSTPVHFWIMLKYSAPGTLMIFETRCTTFSLSIMRHNIPHRSYPVGFL